MKTERIANIAAAIQDKDGKVETNKLIDRLQSTSFCELINDYRIEIPIIQRDYAQGRNNEKTNKIRNSFLDSLITAITKKEKIELDFIYGSVDKDVFQPLDGQQRLTTLFLLHWYIALKAKFLNEETKQILSKFTYETRISSREFCEQLVWNGDKLGVGDTISKQIIDSSWFYLSWQKDPTIDAMLRMLDAIQEQITEELNFATLWKNLIDINSPITFHFIELKEVGLTDDLYIKMNARGKQLTDFENFKARFEKYIEEEIYKKDESGEYIKENGKKIILKDNWEADLKDKPKETFSHKIDTTWSDLFWKHRGEDNAIDNEMLNFIAGIAILRYATEQHIHDKIKKTVIDSIENKTENKSLSDKLFIERRIKILHENHNKVEPEDFPNKEAFDYLKECFEIYSSNDNSFLTPKDLLLWNYCERKKVKINETDAEVDNSLFIEFIKDKNITYSQRVLVYAQTEYLRKAKNIVVEQNLSDWIRVIRNIVENNEINNDTFISAIGLTKEFSSGFSAIYVYLSGNQLKLDSGFAKEQVNEEIAKAKIINKEPDAKRIIHETENTDFCKGRISFALYCIGYDIKKDDSGIFNISELEKILTVINKNFPDMNQKLSDDFKRAFLTIRENNYYEVWRRWSYSFDCYKAWLLNTVNDLKHHFSKSDSWERDYLKDLFLELSKFNLTQIVDNYHIPDGMPKWKIRLIKESNLIKGSTFILYNKVYCKLAWQQRPSREDQVIMIE